MRHQPADHHQDEDHQHPVPELRRLSFALLALSLASASQGLIRRGPLRVNCGCPCV